MKIAWASDLHFNFVTKQQRTDFLNSVDADALIITGDLADAHILEEVLADLHTNTYFVLGNHDSYHGSIEASRELAAKHSGYLSTALVQLTNKTALIGVDGWGDCRYGNTDTSNVYLNDWNFIAELRGRSDLRSKLYSLGDDAAKMLRPLLDLACKFPNVIVATHVPPFAMNDPDYQPYFSCKAVGDLLLEYANHRPNCNITILCGHTHLGGDVQVTHNLRMLVAKADYYKPEVQQIIEID